MISQFVRASVLALLCAASAAPIATPAAARTPYDGSWSVLIVTQRGTCDRAYRYGVEIANGIISYGGAGVSFSGRVAANGAVRVAVTGGDQRANGSGKMNRTSGSGNWSGASSTSRCSGYWTAERR
jgi:hypothetical protein